MEVKNGKLDATTMRQVEGAAADVVRGVMDLIGNTVVRNQPEASLHIALSGLTGAFKMMIMILQEGPTKLTFEEARQGALKIMASASDPDLTADQLADAIYEVVGKKAVLIKDYSGTIHNISEH